VFIVAVVYFLDSVRKLLDTSSYGTTCTSDNLPHASFMNFNKHQQDTLTCQSVTTHIFRNI